MPTFVVSLRDCLSHEVRAVKFFMSEGYCVKCKAKKPIADGVEETMKNGRKAIKGKCPTCKQKADGQWTRAKGHDTFCPVGPWIVTDVDPADLDLRTEVNGQVKQHSRTSLMIHDIGAIVEWISAVMTLLPGDLILTGTPAGVGPIEDGDTVSITIEGIGSLTNPVVRREES